MLKRGITLIGMPGCGKSVLGARLAQETHWPHVDTDDLLRDQFRMSIQELLEHHGEQRFLELEGLSVLSIKSLRETILSPGGSVVHCPDAMKRIKQHTTIVHLHVPSFELEKRLRDTGGERGIVGWEKGLEAIEQERFPLYRNSSHVTINCIGLQEDDVLREIIVELIKLRKDLYNIIS